MAPEQDPPARPRRERPLVAPGRESREEQTPPPPTVTTPPSGRPLIEFAAPDAPPEREDHIAMAFPGPAPQRRWTIALRVVLLIPHFAWLYLLNLAMSVAVVIAWFGALFTKRVPAEVGNFIRRVLRYQMRVTGYGFLLLTDEYPPFGLDADYPIDLKATPGEFNRAAVFFRPILMVPSMIVATLATVGASIVSVVSWLLALILGRLPQPLWEANAAVLRFTARTYGFANMLTAEQPKGLFGDKESVPTALPVDDAPAMPDLPARPRLTRLVLSTAGRRVVVLFLVLAAVVYSGMFVTVVMVGSKLSGAYNQLDDAHDALIVDVDTWSTATQRCAFSGGQPCLAAANTALADGFGDFIDDVSDIKFPTGFGAEELLIRAQRCESTLRAMAAATDEASYQTAAEAYQEAVQAFDEEYSYYAGDLEYES